MLLFSVNNSQFNIDKSNIISFLNVILILNFLIL